MAETITAIATALSASGIGIIRISGPESREITSKIYRSKGGKKDIRQVPSHTIHYGFIQDGEETIDEVLVMVMDGPRSYTGEDVVELSCHGGSAVARRLLEACDVLVDGPFLLEERSLDLRFRGSKNQRVLKVSEMLAGSE